MNAGGLVVLAALRRAVGAGACSLVPSPGAMTLYTVNGEFIASFDWSGKDVVVTDDSGVYVMREDEVPLLFIRNLLYRRTGIDITEGMRKRRNYRIR